MKIPSANSARPIAISDTTSLFKASVSKSTVRGLRNITFAIVAVAIGINIVPVAIAQQAVSKDLAGVTIRGTVVNSEGTPVSGAVVSLEKKEPARALETKTNPDGTFVFPSLPMGEYKVSAVKSGLRSSLTAVSASTENGTQKVELVLSKPGFQAMEFADAPNFTVAGVTDWTAVGGHGSDSSLRTSESLASETLMLKPESTGLSSAKDAGDSGAAQKSESILREKLSGAPRDFAANHNLGDFYLRAGKYPAAIPLLESAYRIDPANNGNQYDLALAYQGTGDLAHARGRIRELLAHGQSADLHRLAGEIDEKLSDPLSAVHEYEQAVKLDPSEQNYFEWGSELLLHRAVWQAQGVFHKGADAYPKSARMQTALGTALFAGARYDEAAQHLCSAADLNPDDPNPYIFMGKIQIVAPNSLACVQPKLAKFVQQQPNNSVGNYLYAMSILKHQEQSPDKQSTQQAEALLIKAVTIDSKCSEGYLQLGIISASQRSFEKAIGFYTKALDADPQLAEAHYRLGVAYDRTGQPAKAKQEFLLHAQIKQQQIEATERQRREVKQFLVVQPGEPATPAIK